MVSGWVVSVRPEVDEQHRNVRECVGVGGVRGWVIGRADAGRAGEHEEVQPLQARTWMDEARNAGVDAPSVQCSVSSRLHAVGHDATRTESESVVLSEEAGECVGLFVGRLGKWLECLGGE